MTMSIIESNVLGDGTLTRATTGTYYDAAGAQQTAAINVPRLSYNPANLTVAPQLLVEATATNLLLNSRPDAWAAYTTSGATGTIALITDPVKGTVVRITKTSGAVGARFGKSQAFNGLVGDSFTASIAAKLNDAGAAGVAIAVFAIKADASGGLSYTETAAGDVGKWVNYAKLCQGSFRGDATAYIWVDGPAGSSIDFVFAQAEIGLVKTSHIPTTGATITRAADVVSATGLIYSTAAENDFPLWVAATAYIIGDKVIRVSTHRIYQRLIAGTTATAPELDAINWLDIAPTNRWAMFDDKVGTKTTAMQSLTVVMRPGPVDGLGMLELVGQTATFVMKDAPGGVVIYNKVIQLDGTLVASFYDWFYKPYQQLTDVVLVDLLSSYVSNELTITITGSSTVSIGVCKFGPITNIGDLQYGAKIGISSLSVKSFDAFGNALITKRGFRKIADFSIVTQATDFNGIFRKFSSLDAVACIYVGSELPGYEPFLIYGFFKDFNMSVDYITHHLCTASIEGLI